MKAAEAEKFIKKYAIYMFTSGIPFNQIENPDLLDALCVLRPDVKLPTRKSLSTTILNEVYDSVKQQVNCKLKQENCWFTLVTDSWRNMRSESVVNYLCASTNVTLFLNSTEVTKERHTGEWICDQINNYFNEHRCFIGACTDNTSANQKAWRLLSGLHPDKFFYGCNSHCLHLLVKDIFDKENDVFLDIHNIYEDCLEITKFFRSHIQEYSQLKSRLTEAGLRFLKMPADTRWGTIKNCMVEVLEAEQILHTYVNQRDWESCAGNKQLEIRQRLKTAINNASFVQTLQKAVNILTPIDQQIVRFQSDSISISDVNDCWLSLLKIFNEMELPQNQLDRIKELIRKRWNFIRRDVHEIAFFLDPRYNHLDPNHLERLTLVKKYLGINSSASDQSLALSCDYHNFLSLSNDFRNNEDGIFLAFHRGIQSIHQFWVAYKFKFPILGTLALKIFSLVCTSASAERNFSILGNIHSKSRSRLVNDKIEKLAFIKTNYHILNQKSALQNDNYSSTASTLSTSNETEDGVSDHELDDIIGDNSDDDRNDNEFILNLEDIQNNGDINIESKSQS